MDCYKVVKLFRRTKVLFIGCSIKCLAPVINVCDICMYDVNFRN